MIEYINFEDFKIDPIKLVIGNTYLRVRTGNKITITSQVTIMDLIQLTKSNIRVVFRYEDGGKKGTVAKDLINLNSDVISYYEVKLV